MAFEHKPHARTLAILEHRVHPTKTRDQLPHGNLYTRVNSWLAVKITLGVGSMTCAWLFCILALLGLPAALAKGGEGPVAWIAQTFLQLVLLSIIIVGTNIHRRPATSGRRTPTPTPRRCSTRQCRSRPTWRSRTRRSPLWCRSWKPPPSAAPVSVRTSRTWGPGRSGWTSGGRPSPRAGLSSWRGQPRPGGLMTRTWGRWLRRDHGSCDGDQPRARKTGKDISANNNAPQLALAA